MAIMFTLFSAKARLNLADGTMTITIIDISVEVTADGIRVEGSIDIQIISLADLYFEPVFIDRWPDMPSVSPLNVFGTTTVLGTEFEAAFREWVRHSGQTPLIEVV